MLKNLTRSLTFSYKDVEETDPLGSDDEDDVIYKEPEPEPEEPSEKIEKVMFHRIGPKWRKFTDQGTSSSPVMLLL